MELPPKSIGAESIFEGKENSCHENFRNLKLVGVISMRMCETSKQLL